MYPRSIHTARCDARWSWESSAVCECVGIYSPPSVNGVPTALFIRLSLLFLLSMSDNLDHTY